MANCLENNLCPKYLELDNSIFEKKNWKKIEERPKHHISISSNAKKLYFNKLTL